MTSHEAGRSIRQNGGAAAVRYEVSKGLAMDEESPAHKLAEQVRGRNDRLTDTELGRLSFLNGQAAAVILEEALEDRDPETAKKVEQLLKNARTGAMDKVPLSDLEDLKERHKENVETAKMPHASGDSDITALQEVVKPQDSDTIKTIEVSLPKNRAQIMHIFRADDGHLTDTPENRTRLLQLAQDSQYRLGVDIHGNIWHAKLLEDGSQLWVEYRDGVIREGGLNLIPHEWDDETGLNNNPKKNGTWRKKEKS